MINIAQSFRARMSMMFYCCLQSQIGDFDRLRRRLNIGGMMQGYQSTPSQRTLNAVERPHCPHCKSRMLLVAIPSLVRRAITIDPLNARSAITQHKCDVK